MCSSDLVPVNIAPVAQTSASAISGSATPQGNLSAIGTLLSKSQLDQMDDQLLLDTVKSRHLQSPSEIIAWSESLTQVAHDLEVRAGTEARKKYDEEIIAAAASSGSPSSGSSDSAE